MFHKNDSQPQSEIWTRKTEIQRICRRHIAMSLEAQTERYVSLATRLEVQLCKLINEMTDACRSETRIVKV